MSVATVRWIGGPVLRARARDPFRLYEAIRVGAAGLPGEVIQLDGEEFVAQVYEDTTGLRPGVTVNGTGRPLSVRLGPGLLGHIFDGLLRPLEGHDSPFMRRGDALAGQVDDGVDALEQVGRRQLREFPFDIAGACDAACCVEVGEKGGDAVSQ